MNGELDTMRQAQAGKQVKRAAQGIVLGIDIGGTFTDYVAYDKEAKIATAWKYFSNAEDPAAGIFDGLKEFQQLDRVEKIRLGDDHCHQRYLGAQWRGCGLHHNQKLH